MNFNSPLEQFEITPLLSLKENIFFFSFHNSALSLILFSVISFLFFFSALNISYFIPSKIQLVLESVYEFVFSMLKQQAGVKSYAFFPFLFTVFIFIALSNGFGLIPFSFTATSHIIVTFFLALVFNLSFIFLGFSLHGLKFLTLFVPSGVPNALKPLLVVIELISYLIRTFSLSLRLFANMMAGHTLLLILSSFVIIFLNLGPLLSLGAAIPFFLVLFVYFLEIGIAFLQAYVFSILLAIYLNDSLNLH